MIKMNFDKVIGSFINEGIVRPRTEEEHFKKATEATNELFRKGQIDHPLPTDKLPASGAILHTGGAFKGDTQLRSAAVSKQHLDELGGTINDRLDIFRAKVGKGITDLEKAPTEESLRQVAVSLIPYLYRLVRLKDEKTSILLSNEQYIELEKLVKNLAKTIKDKRAKFAKTNATQDSIRFDDIFKSLETLIIKNPNAKSKGLGKEYKEDIGNKSKMQFSQGEHWFALSDESTPTNWIIYTKKVQEGALPFIKDFDQDEVWKEGPGDIRKWIVAKAKYDQEHADDPDAPKFEPPQYSRRPPIVWINNKPQYGKLLPVEYVSRKNFNTSTGDKAWGVNFPAFLEAVGDSCIFEVIVAKYWENKKGNFTTTKGFTINLDKLTVSKYKLAQGQATPQEIQLALHQKKEKSPVSATGSSATTQADSSSDEEMEENPEGEEDEF